MKKSKIVLHGTASAFGSVHLIRKWHVEEREWMDIGYNLLITNGYITPSDWKTRHRRQELDGRCWPGRDLNDNPHDWMGEKGAHAYGYNTESIGIALVSDDTGCPPTRSQIRSTLIACSFLVNLYDMDWQNVVGHYELNDQKTDPYFDMDQFRDAMVRGYLAHSLPDLVFNSIMRRAG